MLSERWTVSKHRARGWHARARRRTNRLRGERAWPAKHAWCRRAQRGRISWASPARSCSAWHRGDTTGWRGLHKTWLRDLWSLGRHARAQRFWLLARHLDAETKRGRDEPSWRGRCHVNSGVRNRFFGRSGGFGHSLSLGGVERRGLVAASSELPEGFVKDAVTGARHAPMVPLVDRLSFRSWTGSLPFGRQRG